MLNSSDQERLELETLVTFSHGLLRRAVGANDVGAVNQHELSFISQEFCESRVVCRLFFFESHSFGDIFLAWNSPINDANALVRVIQ